MRHRSRPECDIWVGLSGALGCRLSDRRSTTECPHLLMDHGVPGSPQAAVLSGTSDVRCVVACGAESVVQISHSHQYVARNYNRGQILWYTLGWSRSSSFENTGSVVRVWSRFQCSLADGRGAMDRLSDLGRVRRRMARCETVKNRLAHPRTDVGQLRKSVRDKHFGLRKCAFPDFSA